MTETPMRLRNHQTFLTNEAAPTTEFYQAGRPSTPVLIDVEGQRNDRIGKSGR